MIKHGGIRKLRHTTVVPRYRFTLRKDYKTV
jgi:hypothetical protein